MKQFSAFFTEDIQNISDSIKNIFNKIEYSYNNIRINNEDIDRFILKAVLPGIINEFERFLGENLIKNLEFAMEKNGDFVLTKTTENEDSNMKMDDSNTIANSQKFLEDKEEEPMTEFAIRENSNGQELNNNSKKIESLSTIPISRILFRNKGISEVQNLKAKLDQGKQILDEKLIKELLDVYQLLYKRPDDRASGDLEKYLESMKSFNIRFTHATIGFFRETAPRFEIVKKHYAKAKLKDYELIKIQSEEFDNDSSEDMILFELCPQVYLNDEMIFPGKIIVG